MVYRNVNLKMEHNQFMWAHTQPIRRPIYRVNKLLKPEELKNIINNFIKKFAF